MFDANVWLLIQGYFTNPRDPRVKLYSGFYESAIAQEASLFIAQTVLSEFVNRAIRIRAKEAGWDQQGKLHHQANYNDWIDDASNDIYHISKGANFIDDGFSNINFDVIVNEVKSCTLDFNDVLIKSMCVHQKLTLVTDDADFKGHDIPIITGNHKLLP